MTFRTTRLLCAWLVLPVIVSGCALGQSASSQTPPTTPPTSATAGSTTIVAVAPAGKKHGTLPEFLGITGLVKGVGGLFHGILNRLGAFYPGLEPTSALTSIADPANLDSSNPAIASAAQAKSEEDKKQQKIKALRYLATIGCGGCYPGVEKAFLSALDDCTEEVRFEAVKAIRKTAGDPCRYCNSEKCCSPQLMAKLHHIANDMTDQGCYKEPSDRVRRLARLAMDSCGGSALAQATQLPTEGPPPAPAPAIPDEGPPTAGTTATAEDSSIGRDDEISPSRSAIQRVSHTELVERDGNADRLPEVRWERITARYPRFDSPEQAREVITWLRTRILAGGDFTDPPTKVQLVEAQIHGWTAPESMPNEAMTFSMLTTPVGEISEVFEDENGVHAVRILQRRVSPAKTTK